MHLSPVPTTINSVAIIPAALMPVDQGQNIHCRHKINRKHQTYKLSNLQNVKFHYMPHATCPQKGPNIKKHTF